MLLLLFALGEIYSLFKQIATFVKKIPLQLFFLIIINDSINYKLSEKYFYKNYKNQLK